MKAFACAVTRPGTNIIAEVKYTSPSHGPFACQLPPAEIGRIYIANGAIAISVLTEKPRFGGDLNHLRTVADLPDCPPLLRKDFITDPAQVRESLTAGASAYLLIVGHLAPSRLRDLMRCGDDQGLEPLVEVHDPFELDTALEQGARLIGVNNRNLHTFKVDLGVAFDLARRMKGETGRTLICESGISERLQILELKDTGYSAFLIGSALMDAPDPGQKLRELRGVS